MIRVADLSVVLDGRRVLDRVSLDLVPGQVTGLVGESGSGKSMTALAVMGLLPQRARASGQVALDGRNLLALPERELCRIRGARIGMIFQEPMTALNPLMTIGDQVAEVLRLHQGLNRRAALGQARERLDRVGLPAPRFPLSLYPHELSGGQRQRVAIALAIALRPDLLIADEPTTALDVTTQARILDLLKDLVRDEGMALLLITHDLAVVAGMADRVAVMQNGRIAEEGPTGSLFRGPRHPYTRQLLDASRPAPARPASDFPTPLVQVEGAVRDYRTADGGLRALDGISMTIGRGESVGLVGESGCGKSTTARLVMRLIEPSAGTIRFDGQDVTTASGGALRALRRRMQIVFQDPFSSLDPRRRIGPQIADGMDIHGLASGAEQARIVGELLARVGLDPAHAQRFPHEFSGGQRQRIGIARALAVEPEMIVADEPVSALDVSVQAGVVNLFAELRERLGLTLVFITHDLRLVRHLTERVAVMYLGKVVEEGPTKRLFAAPRHPYTRRLMACVPVLGQPERALDAIPGLPPAVNRLPPGCHFADRCDRVIDRCRIGSIPLEDLGPGRSSRCIRAFEP